MAQLNAGKIDPVQSVHIPQVYSVWWPENSGLPRALRKPLFHQVKLSNHCTFMPAAPKAYMSASSSNLENHQPSKRQCWERLSGPGAMLAQCALTLTAQSALMRASMSLRISAEQGRQLPSGLLRPWPVRLHLKRRSLLGYLRFKPSIDQVQDCIEKRPPRISPRVAELIDKLKARNTDVYLVSGGFRQMIKPVALELGISHANIFANQLLFGTSGNYVGFDPTEPTSRSGGKAVAVQQIRQKCRYKSLVMIGDGATDLEARQPGAADLFICYGGIKIREVVARKADWVVSDFHELMDYLK